MCDYSAHGTKTRAANKEDVLVTRHISSHTRGFVGVADPSTAVCLLPGTELAFDKPVRTKPNSIINAIVEGMAKLIGPAPADQKVATFVQVNKDDDCKHHDALKFADGSIVLLNALDLEQIAQVVSLPADPSTLDGKARDIAIAEQRRAEYV